MTPDTFAGDFREYRPSPIEREEDARLIAEAIAAGKMRRFGNGTGEELLGRPDTSEAAREAARRARSERARRGWAGRAARAAG